MASKKRLIDADARIEEIKKAHCTGCESYGGVRCRACWVDDAIGLIDDAPTVDAVEVVQCKDCKHYGYEQEPCHGRTHRFCKLHKGLIVVNRDTFCSYGERREGE